MSNTEDIIMMLNAFLVIIIFLIAILGGLAIFIILKNKRNKNSASFTGSVDGKGKSGKDEQSLKMQGIESMSKFMEFDEVVDNMIVRKNRQQYIMAIQCKGVNYDLLAEDEKIAVENGFVQFLNVLRYPIQLYVQTRSLNLREIIDEYKERVEQVREDIMKLDSQIAREKTRGTNEKLIKRMEFDRRRKVNILEYGVDIADYVGKMSQNRNVLQQNTYIIVSYYTAEFGGQISNYSKEEVNNIAFSELYTRAQTAIRGISSAGVSGRILNSEELVELLYVAYNRDDSEILNLKKVMDSEFTSIYSTGRDVLDKKQELIDSQIDVAAIEFTTSSIKKADELRKLKKENEDEIKKRALSIVKEYQAEMDEDLYKETRKQILNNPVVKEKRRSSQKGKQTSEKTSNLQVGRQSSEKRSSVQKSRQSSKKTSGLQKGKQLSKKGSGLQTGKQLSEKRRKMEKIEESREKEFSKTDKQPSKKRVSKTSKQLAVKES